MTTTPYLFADDMKIFKRICNVADQATLQQNLDKISDWIKTWLLNMNPGKCKLMTISECNILNQRNYYINSKRKSPTGKHKKGTRFGYRC